MKRHDILIEGKLAQVKPNIHVRELLLFKIFFHLKIYFFKK
jgi:hypothetical protein